MIDFFNHLFLLLYYFYFHLRKIQGEQSALLGSNTDGTWTARGECRGLCVDNVGVLLSFSTHFFFAVLYSLMPHEKNPYTRRVFCFLIIHYIYSLLLCSKSTQR